MHRNAMSHRERVLTTLGHREPDRVPIDLGGTDGTGIMVGPYRRLCAHFGIDPDPVRVIDPMQQVPLINEKLQHELETDCIGIYQLPKAWRKDRAYDGSEILYPLDFRPETMSGGRRVVRNASGEIDWDMPPGVYYFEPVLRPLKDISTIPEIDKVMDLIISNDRPTWLDLGWEELGKQTRTLRETTDSFLIGEFWGHIFQSAWLLRGFEEFMLDLAIRPALAEALMDRLAEAHIRAFDEYARTVAPYVDVICVNDDLGTQDAPFMSPEMYRKIVKPYHSKLFSHIKANCVAPLWMHSDGALYPLIPDLIDMGVDILNPVQFTAKGMESARLKREFGADLSFWGGGVDTQGVLPFGNPEEVAENVQRCMDALAPGGGFVFAAVHNIQEGVPTENIVSLFSTALEHGWY